MKGGNKMKAKETAVVLIEFQNEFCKEGGKLHDGVKGEIDRQNTIPNAVKLSEGARKKGALVIHSPFVFNEKYFKDHQMLGIVKAVADGDAFREGTWGAEIIDELKPQEGDKVVGGKCTLCGFNKTNKDATAATSEEEQNHAEAKIFPLLGQTLSVDQFLEQLEE
jgi:ureidoacrylate peracid hydrolase